MSKTVYLIVMVILLGNYSNAQQNNSDSRGDFHFGVKAGVNYSNVWDSEGEEFRADHKLGFAGGVFAAIPIGKLIGIQPEVLYSQKGFQASGSLLGLPYEFTRTTDFIDIPLFLQVKPAAMVTVLAGPQFSYLLKKKDEFNNTITNLDQQQVFENDNFRKNILSMVGGIDINLSKLVVGARVGRDIHNNNGDGTSTTPRYKNSWGQLTLGLRF